jgi:predicted nucleic acid-binding protein
VSYLLDTNVVSETRRRPKGIVQRSQRDPAGAERLARWLSGLRQLFAERILVVGDAEATCWGDLAG